MLTLHVNVQPSAHDRNRGTPVWVVSGESAASRVEYPSRHEAELDALTVIERAIERGLPAQLFIHHPDGATTQFKTGN
jgi:hypothetical protein